VITGTFWHTESQNRAEGHSKPSGPQMLNRKTLSGGGLHYG